MKTKTERCPDCYNEMTVSSCKMPYIVLKGRVFKRNVRYFDHNERCHDCGIENKKGNIHHFGCDMERCPRCKRQLISCGCISDKDCFIAESRQEGLYLLKEEE